MTPMVEEVIGKTLSDDQIHLYLLETTFPMSYMDFFQMQKP